MGGKAAMWHNTEARLYKWRPLELCKPTAVTLNLRLTGWMWPRRILVGMRCLEGFPGGSDGKESACNVGDSGSIPGSGRCPGEGNGNPLQWCLESWETSQISSKNSDIWFLSEPKAVHSSIFKSGIFINIKAACPALGIRQILHTAARPGAPIQGSTVAGGCCGTGDGQRPAPRANITGLTVFSLSSQLPEQQVFWNPNLREYS